MISDTRKFCIVYVNSCPWTTGNYVLKAFQKLGLDVVYADPTQAANVKADKYLYVDSGHEYYISTPRELTSFYSIDAYQNELELYKKGNYTRLSWWLYVRENVDFIFDAFEYGYRWFSKQGNKAVYISMGYDEDIFTRPIDLPKPYDVCFVGGRKSEGLRGKILDHVAKNFKLYSPQTYNEGIVKAMAQCKCFLDIPPVEDDMLGQRFFEGYAMQVPMVSQERPSLLNFSDGVYRYNTWDLEGSLNRAIAGACAHRSRVNRDLSGLTWTSRVKRVLEYI